MTSTPWHRREAPRWAVWPALLVLVLCATGGLVGLVSPPVLVERDVQVRVVTRERVEWRERLEYRDRTQVQTRTVTRDVPVVLYVDGGVRVERELVTVTEYREARDVGVATDASGSGSSSTSTETREVHRETPVLPSWRVGLQVGGQFAGAPAVALPDAPGLVLGLEAAYRLPLDRLGLPPRYSLWIGAWGGTYGAAGGVISGEF